MRSGGVFTNRENLRVAAFTDLSVACAREQHRDHQLKRVAVFELGLRIKFAFASVAKMRVVFGVHFAHPHARGGTAV